MASLPNAEADLERIKSYLRPKVRFAHDAAKRRKLLDKITLRNTAVAERNNKENPRMVCYVVSGSHVINCSRASEAVGPRARVGLLIHEMGHVLTRSGDVPDEEVQADLWVEMQFHHSGYTYRDHIYVSPHTGKQVTAKHVEHVSEEFLKKLRL